MSFLTFMFHWSMGDTHQGGDSPRHCSPKCEIFRPDSLFHLLFKISTYFCPNSSFRGPCRTCTHIRKSLTPPSSRQTLFTAEQTQPARTRRVLQSLCFLTLACSNPLLYTYMYVCVYIFIYTHAHTHTFNLSCTLHVYSFVFFTLLIFQTSSI